MSPKCRHVNATSTQRLPACLQEALRALLARRTSPSLALFFQHIADRMDYFRLSNKILDLPEITRKQLPIGFSVRCARARADAFCSLRARLYPPLWCCALVQDPHDTAGGALSSPNPPRGTRWVTLLASDMYPPLLHTLQFVAIVAPSIAPALLASSTIPPLQLSFAITKRCSVAFLHF